MPSSDASGAEHLHPHAWAPRTASFAITESTRMPVARIRLTNTLHIQES